LPPPTVVVVRILHRPLPLYHPLLYQYKTCSHCPNQQRPCPCTHLIIHECSPQETKESYDVDSEVILKPPKNKSYKPNEIKLLGKLFQRLIFVMLLLGQGTRQKLLYTGILRVLPLYIRHCQLEVDALVKYASMWNSPILW